MIENNKINAKLASDLFLEYVYSSDNEKLLIMVFENNTDKVQIIKKDFSFID